MCNGNADKIVYRHHHWNEYLCLFTGVETLTLVTAEYKRKDCHDLAFLDEEDFKEQSGNHRDHPVAEATFPFSSHDVGRLRTRHKTIIENFMCLYIGNCRLPDWKIPTIEFRMITSSRWKELYEKERRVRTSKKKRTSYSRLIHEKTDMVSKHQSKVYCLFTHETFSHHRTLLTRQ